MDRDDRCTAPPKNRGGVRLHREEGAGMVEYAILVALIAILLVGALTFLRTGLNNSFSNSGSLIENAS